MTDAMQRCEGGVDDSSAGSPSSVSDETDPAGVVLEARVVQARVTQGRYSTLSVRPVPRHGRLQPKGTRPVVPSAQVGARRSGATDNRSAPASISPPPSPPWTREARRVPSVILMLALGFGSVKRLAYANLTNSHAGAKRLARANRAQHRDCSVTAHRRARPRAVNVAPGAGHLLMAGRDRGVGGSGARQGRTTVTLEDVARAAGVHYSTVSRALDPTAVRRVSVDARKHIQSVAKKMGYQPDMVAPGLKRGRTQTVAAIVADLGNPSSAPVLRGMASRLEPAGFMSLFAETQDDSSR